MKGDRFGGKRTNWLLIKHADEYRRDGDDDRVLAQGRSVSRCRTLERDSRRQRAGAKAVHDGDGESGSAGAVWQFEQGSCRRSARRDAARRRRGRGKGSKGDAMPAKTVMPDFVAPQLCQASERPPSGVNWVHEIKFDGYRIQMRVEDGEVSLKTRKALDWTERFPEIAKAAAKLPDFIIDGEVVALNAKGDPDFSALQAALSDGDTEDLIYFAFDLLFVDGEDLRRLPLTARKERLEALLEKYARAKSSAAALCRAFRRRR